MAAWTSLKYEVIQYLFSIHHYRGVPFIRAQIKIQPPNPKIPESRDLAMEGATRETIKGRDWRANLHTYTDINTHTHLSHTQSRDGGGVDAVHACLKNSPLSLRILV